MYLSRLTDEATEKYNADEYILYFSIPMNIKLYYYVTCNQVIYFNIFIGYM
jgi:hypothetical protein